MLPVLAVGRPAYGQRKLL